MKKIIIVLGIMVFLSFGLGSNAMAQGKTRKPVSRQQATVKKVTPTAAQKKAAAAAVAKQKALDDQINSLKAENTKLKLQLRLQNLQGDLDKLNDEREKFIAEKDRLLAEIDERIFTKLTEINEVSKKLGSPPKKP